MKRYYEILGVGRDTPLDEVHQSYRDLVRVWHPDRFSGDYRLSRISEEKLKLINEAYREIRAHIERSTTPEQGVLFKDRRPANGSASPGEGEYMFDFYDPEYSPWIWTYQRERGSGPATATPRIRWSRIALVAGGICVLGLSGAAAAWRFGLIPGAPSVPAPPAEVSAETTGPLAPASGLADRPSPPVSTDAPVSPEIGETRLRVGASPFGSGIRKGRSRVTIENDTGDDAVVKLALVGSEGTRMVRSVFLPAGRTFTATEVPPGRYLVKVALGAEWDLRAMRFRRPSGFAASSGVELDEEATDLSRTDGIVVRQLVASELRVTLNRILGTRITEAEFLAD